VRDADDIAGLAAVEEEALDGAGQVAVTLRLSIDVEEFVPAADEDRLIERSTRRQADETGHARVGRGQRLLAR